MLLTIYVCNCTLVLIRLHKKADLLEMKVDCMNDRKVLAALTWERMDTIDPVV